MKITKYYLEKELKFILCNIHEIKMKYSIFKQLYIDEKFNSINIRLCSLSSIFFRIIIKKYINGVKQISCRF